MLYKLSKLKSQGTRAFSRIVKKELLKCTPSPLRQVADAYSGCAGASPRRDHIRRASDGLIVEERSAPIEVYADPMSHILYYNDELHRRDSLSSSSPDNEATSSDVDDEIDEDAAVSSEDD